MRTQIQTTVTTKSTNNTMKKDIGEANTLKSLKVMTTGEGRGREHSRPTLSYKPNLKIWIRTTKRNFSNHAWNEYKTTGKMDMLERFSYGFIFAQLSAKNECYGREAELKLQSKKLMEYKTFHGRKADELTKEQKKKAANMINLIEEKVDRGHTRETR